MLNGNPPMQIIVLSCTRVMKRNTVLHLASLMAILLVGSGREAGAQLSLTNFTSTDIGNPVLAGSSVAMGNNVDVTGAGSDIGGTNDQFQFTYQQVSGDFDVNVRLESLTPGDPWAKAGLMARESLTGGSRYTAAFATPSVSGCFFQFRTFTAGQTTNIGSFPVTYPNTWLRLKRAGNVFTGYASPDNVNWAQLGSFNLSPAPTGPMFVGLVATSRNTNQALTAQFRDFANVTGTPSTATPVLSREPIGPSSRRTALAISEIMYHPRATPGVSGSLEFIELYNSQAFDTKIGGFRISGSVDYVFPANTIIKSGQYLVVAREPSTVQSYYGITGVLGPWNGASTNSLPGGSGTVRLRNRAGAVLLEVNYEGRNPWPIAADGAGHSLVLARPSYGEGDPQAWAPSDSFGGSPGRAEPFSSEPLSSVVINEFLAHTEPSLGVEDYLELYNHSNVPVDLSGAYLTDESSTNKFRIPNGTVIGPTNFMVFGQTALGFALNAAGERIYLVNSNQNRVINAVDYDAQANGVSFGRYPDGAPAFYEMAARTPGAPNGAYLRRPIVINELMYDPVSGNNEDEYLELYNRTTNAVDVSLWRFTAGINFTIPTNTVIPSNGFLVVARSMTNLFAHYPNLNSGNTVGDYKGGLANGGERLALAMPEILVTTNTNNVAITNTIYVTVNEVTYNKGGRWGNWSAGGGSSLELVDPNSDNRQPANWADSDETAKSQWTAYEFTGPTGETLSANGDTLQIFLLGIGECLIDEVEVRVAGGANLVTNPGFESGMTGWTPQGSHDFSTIENVGFAGNSSLHLRAASRGDNGANRIRSPALVPNATGVVTLRAKARWLRGWPEVLLRLHGGGAEAIGRMAVPLNLGTPGAPNSQRVPNAGPAIYSVQHSPPLPQAGENVLVTCRVTDPDGIGSLTLKYRVDAGNTVITPALFSSIPMLDNGAGGDAVAGDGLYSATLPGRPANGTVSFYVQAVDRLNATNLFPQDVFPAPGLPRCFPNDAIARECVVRWGDTMMLGSFATYHLWLTYANSNRWASRTPQLNNAQVDATFVYNNYRTVYNTLPLYAGSPWHRGQMTTGPAGANRVDYVQNFPPDDQLLGNTDFVLNNPGNPGGTSTSDHSAQTEQTSYIIFDEIGLVTNHRRYIHYFVNGSQRSTSSDVPGNFIFEDSQQPNGDMIAEWFPDDTGGNLFKIEDWFEFPDNGFDFTANNDADLSRRTINLNGQSVLTIAPYRFMFRARSVGAGESANDYANLFSLIDAVSPNGAFGPSGASNSAPVPDPAAFDAIADIEQWMRIFAVQHTVGNWDSYGYARGKNDYAYKPVSGRFAQMTWDIDFTMGVGGDGAGFALFSANDPRVLGMWNTPVIARHYWRGLQDIVNGPLNNSFLDPMLDAKHAALRANNVNADVSTVNTIKNYVAARRAFLVGELARVSPGFAVFGTNNFTVSNNLVVLSGGAPITVKNLAISINGADPVTYPVTWTGAGAYNATNWAMRLVLHSGTNVITVQGFDRLGNPVTGAARVVTVNYTGPDVDPQGAVVFNEIMYNPTAPEASFVELFNTANAAFDLSGFRVNGLDYTFPVGSIMSSRQLLVLAKNRLAFATAYANATAFGQFDGNLDLDGETLTLLKPGVNGSPDLVVDKVRYEARAPWGAGANGFGPSLQLIDGNQDNSRVSNWTDHEEWRYATFTGTISGGITLGTNFLMFMQVPGDVYLDDLMLVAGTQAGVGQNLIANGDFESALSGPWTVLGNHSNSVVSTEFSHSGSSSLHLIATGNGGASAAIRQYIAPFDTNTVCTLSFWFRPSTNGTVLWMRTTPGSTFVSTNAIRPIFFTPGAPNAVAAPLPVYDPLWLNELQADNLTGPVDNVGQHDPWIELYNAGPVTLNLSGYFLANNYDTNLTQWQFPAGSSIAPAEFKIIWADGQPEQTAGTNLHTSFRLNSTIGSLALVRLNGDQPQITDYLTYSELGRDFSYGDFPDGQPFSRQVLRDVTPRGTNIARFVDLFINEWMAGNTNSLADPADGHYDDWFEIYNAGSEAVDLGGFLLTDSPGNSAQYYRVPTNGQYVIPARGFLLVWADNEPNQNSADQIDLHAGFQLSKSGEQIALYGPDARTLIDMVSFGPQTDDISEGRFPDGAPNISALSLPSPRMANHMSGGNTPPQLAAIQSRTIRLGQTVSFTAEATDSDVPAQTLSFNLQPGFPAGAGINSASGLFSWTPLQNQAPSTNSFTVRVTDNGVPPQSASRSFTVIVLLPPQALISREGLGSIHLVFDSTPGHTYQVQYKDNLSESVWRPLNPPVVADNNTLNTSDAINPAAQRFYRIVQLD